MALSHIALNIVSTSVLFITCGAMAISLTYGKRSFITEDAQKLSRYFGAVLGSLVVAMAALTLTYGAVLYSNGNIKTDDWSEAGNISHAYVVLGGVYFLAMVASGCLWLIAATQLYCGHLEVTPRGCLDLSPVTTSKAFAAFWMVFGFLEGITASSFGRAYFFHLIPIAIGIIAWFRRAFASSRRNRQCASAMGIIGWAIYGAAGVVVALLSSSCPNNELPGDASPSKIDSWSMCDDYEQFHYTYICFGVQALGIVIASYGLKLELSGNFYVADHEEGEMSHDDVPINRSKQPCSIDERAETEGLKELENPPSDKRAKRKNKKKRRSRKDPNESATLAIKRKNSSREGEILIIFEQPETSSLKLKKKYKTHTIASFRHVPLQEIDLMNVSD